MRTLLALCGYTVVARLAYTYGRSSVSAPAAPGSARVFAAPAELDPHKEAEHTAVLREIAKVKGETAALRARVAPSSSLPQHSLGDNAAAVSHALTAAVAGVASSVAAAEARLESSVAAVESRVANLFRHSFAPSARAASDGVRADCRTRAAQVEAMHKCVLDAETGERACFEPEVQFCPSSARHGSSWPVYLEPQDKSQPGWRFWHLATQGLREHPYVTLVDSPREAEFVVYLPVSTKPIPNASAGATADKLLVLDEGDGTTFYPKVKSDSYLIYFKRSFVRKRDGKYTGVGSGYARAYLPMVYSVSDGYLRVDGTLTKFSERKFDVVCTLRPIPEKQPTRTRVLEWVAEAVEKFGVPAERARVGEVNHAQRRGISDEFLEAQFSSKIIVTCNPSHWEGDFRLWEAVASGALVFVDNMWVPTAHPFVDGEHLILYDQHDKDAFLRKLGYYLSHPDEARAIAKACLAHALKHHRAVSRMDFLLRSAHEERLRNAHGAAEGAAYPAAEPKLYTQTAREVASDPSFLMHEAEKLAMAKERRRAAANAPQGRRRARRPLRRR